MQQLYLKTFFISLLLFFSISPLQAQDQLPFLQAADTLHKTRFWTSVGIGTGVYAGVSIGLWETWYKGYEISGFHTFNDWGEWNQMDKVGHTFSAYNETAWAFKGALWTGMKRRNAMWTAVGIGTGIQATIEVMDGFSKKWGFSWGDIAFNTVGVTAFAAQELLWAEQRITFKASTNLVPYSTTPILSSNSEATSSLANRGAELYGTNFVEIYLKDYNKLSLWASANIHAFAKNKVGERFPKWLNIAVGYGSENLYGGFGNSWTEGDAAFVLDNLEHPRYRQFYLSLDVDMTRIKTNNRFLKSLFTVINFIKIPSPTFEINTLGKVKFHPIYW